jgi:hypothetical protein
MGVSVEEELRGTKGGSTWFAGGMMIFHMDGAGEDISHLVHT